MMVEIDPRRCQNTGYCIRLAPALFGPGQDGAPTRVLVADPGPDLQGLAREAEALCPVGAISVGDGR